MMLANSIVMYVVFYP